MQTHARRRNGPRLTSAPFFTLLIAPLLIFFLCFATPASAAGSAVLGIDFGTEYLTAVLVKPGIPLEIVPTKDSKRKESAAVAFKPARESDAVFPERFYGGDALALAPRFPDDVYINLKTLLGVSFADNDGIIDLYKSRYPALRLERAPGDRDTVGLRSNKLGGSEGKDAFMVEEILAMLLKQIKVNAENFAGEGSVVEDVVITYPNFYTAEEKRSVKLAAELAGLNVEALISDGLAVGLNYATTRTFPSVTEGQDPEYHVVYDSGAGSTTATVLRFQSRTIKELGRFNKTVQEVHVLGTGHDRTLGGDSLNQLIVDDMVDKLLASNKLREGTTEADIKAHGKAMAKLWKEAGKVRHILSANTETGSTLEGVFDDDVTIRYDLKRSDFEKLAEAHASRVRKPLDDALAAAGLGIDKITSVILHGGLTRTPFVQKQLEQAVGDSKKLRNSVNADEAAAFGAAFKGAALSPSFRVKDIRTADAGYYTIKVEWTSDGKERQQKLFTSTSLAGVEKEVTVKNLEDFEFRFYQLIPAGDDPVEVPVTSVATQNLTASVAKLKSQFGCAPANVTTKFTVRLSPTDGQPEVVAGSVSCEVDQSKKTSVMDDVKGFFGLGSKKDEQKPLAEEKSETPESVTSQEQSTSASTSTSSGTEKSSAANATESKANNEAKVKVETIQIALKSSPLGRPPLSGAELSRIKKRLAAFDAADRERVQREEAFNELEAFVYHARGLLEDEDFVIALKDGQAATLKGRLEDVNDWLYGDGQQAKIKALKEKLSSLRDIVDPAVRRKEEHAARDDQVAQLEKLLEGAKSVLEMVTQQIKADEEAFSSARSASSSSSSSEQSASSETSTSAAATNESDLDEDPYASSSSRSETSSDTSSAPPSSSTPTYTLYTPADLNRLQQVLNSASEWLTTQREKQSTLKASDDPVLTVADISQRAQEIQRALRQIYIKAEQQPKGKSEGKKDKGKEKRSKGAKNATSSSSSSSTSATPSVKDEL
ncbi:hypothetical protein VTN31DRAFT_945 [Thermomyces dupontii]|uniref:uncharacterized protein n=1 Tax=Talaromyces thermophilus TaxID=28565 RepID=UPI003741FCE3